MDTPEWIPVLGTSAGADDPFPDRAARWAVELDYHEIPRPVRRAAKAQLTGTVGAALRTRGHPIGDRIDAATRTADRGPATFLGGRRTDPEPAAVGNAALSLGLGFEGSILGGSTGTSCVFVPLAYGEAVGADGDELLTAQIAANEVAGRLGAATTVGPFSGGNAVWIHAAGAAVGRAVIEGDDAETLAEALTLALSQPGRPIGQSWGDSDSGHLAAGDPIRAGIAALENARAGLAGPQTLFDGDGDLLSTLSARPVEGYLSGFGERWHTAATSVAAVPGSVPLAAATEAALEARGRFDRGRTTIDRVEVAGPHALVSGDSGFQPDSEADRSVATSLRSVPLAVATALVEGEAMPSRVGTPAPGVERVADRVRVEHDPSLTAAALRSAVPEGVDFRSMGRFVAPAIARAVGPVGTLRHPIAVLGTGRRLSKPADPATLERAIGARVTVRTAGGRTVEASIDRPAGTAGGPPAEIRAVARTNCRGALEALGATESVARGRTEELLGIDGTDEPRLDRIVEDNNT